MLDCNYRNYTMYSCTHSGGGRAAEAGAEEEGHREAAGEREGAARHLPHLRGGAQVRRVPHQGLQEEDQEVQEEGHRRRW